MRPVNLKQHPLLRAMALLTRAKRTRAHPRMIRHLQRRVTIEAQESRNRFARVGGIAAVAEGIKGDSDD